MSNRPIGNWGRPQCVSCGSSAQNQEGSHVQIDTAHGFTCPRHAEALQWFWDVAQSFTPSSPLDISLGSLLGGCSPCDELSNNSGLGYVWEVLRVSFISTLFRFWTRSSICAQHDNTQVHYESRHIILSTISQVRVVALVDARRALNGIRTILRDGSVHESDRFRRILRSSWIQSGFLIEQEGGDPCRYIPKFSSSWPVRVDLGGLQPFFFPARGRSQRAHSGFTF
jgi:hypothetical protein